ncbi:MAG TPA: DNA-formamidopyrimidine glycosylase family protein [Gemmatimonadaceae bacterium]|nr:DNA-formamidopyrimidine glycosylase family protein [Gemmatimonadaceae bacterium]
MPELPETETIARDLDAALRGAIIRTVNVARADVAIEWPECAPRWWDREAVQRALAVELQATGASARPGERYQRDRVMRPFVSSPT